MKEDNDIFKKFRDSFSKIDGHFHILEQRVPVERQMEYFKYSEKIRKDQDKPDISKMDFSVFEDSLDDPESTTEHKKYVLSMLATSRQVKAYRILEEYAQAPDPDVGIYGFDGKPYRSGIRAVGREADLHLYRLGRKRGKVALLCADPGE
jgi:hypothetical protein